jgi:hypothetical protein
VKFLQLDLDKKRNWLSEILPGVILYCAVLHLALQLVGYTTNL